MLIQNEFAVDAPIEHVWPALCDLPRLAMCVPYTESVRVVDWGTYDVRIALRFGLITIKYDGELLLRSRNDDTKTLAIYVSGKQALGTGGVRGEIALHAVTTETGTRVEVRTQADFSGLVTSFGPAVIESVARRTIAEFAKRFRAAMNR